MLRTLCDRCGADTTGIKSAAVAIIGDADIHGNGSVTRTADLCIPCRDALATWLGKHDAASEEPKNLVRDGEARGTRADRGAGRGRAPHDRRVGAAGDQPATVRSRRKHAAAARAR